MKKYTLAISLVFLIIVSLILSYKFIFQSKKDIKSVLDSKDFIAFNIFLENLSESDHPRSHWKYLRDLTYNHKEGIFEFYQFKKDKKGRITSAYETFQVKLIATENEIIYYEFSIQKNKKVKYEWSDSYSWEPYYEKIEEFRNDTEFEIFKKAFKKIFHSELNKSELFITNYVYGENCGVGGMNTRERMQLNDFVTKKDQNSILKWLKSANTEKQVYAVEGILKLKKSGIKLSKSDLEIIKYIINKKGTINVCHGCIYSSKEVREVTERIYKEFPFL